MPDDCPMTEDCPGYDHDRGVCLLRPDDCEFAPAALGRGNPPGGLRTDVEDPPPADVAPPS